MGGSFVASLISREKVHMDVGILGSSDLVTKIPDKIEVKNTQIHILYALKMGEKYLFRYEKHFASPVIHRLDYKHEELLFDYPKDWVKFIKEILK